MTFAQLMAGNQILSLKNFMVLLDSQYEASKIDPAGNPARWALINAMLARATRLKIASGSESAILSISHALYQNATAVMPDLILVEPSLVIVQALLGMAIFAVEVADTQAFIMLTTNTLRQLQLLEMKLRDSPHLNNNDSISLQHMSRAANELTDKMNLMLN